MTTALEVTDKDFEQMMQMLTGFWMTQIACAVATYSVADQLARGPATAEDLRPISGVVPGSPMSPRSHSMGILLTD